MNKIDVLFLSFGRPEFTAASLRTLCRNTPAELVDQLYICTDGDDPPQVSLFADFGFDAHIVVRKFGGPVAIMNAFLECYSDRAEIFAKIDNDTIVPPGWLASSIAIMEASPELDLLGIEPPASRTPSSAHGKISPKPELDGPVVLLPGSKLGYAPAASIGGIGLMRRSAWKDRPRMHPHGFNGVGGFTTWQTANPSVIKGWAVPPLNVFLLDRLPIAPWDRLSAEYVKAGVQRPWTAYSPEAVAALWEWWTLKRAAARPLLSIIEDGAGWRVVLGCGHTVHVTVLPRTPLPCGECFDEFVRDCGCSHF